MKTKKLATVYAIVAAVLYAINVPFSKILLGYVEPTMMAALLRGWQPEGLTEELLPVPPLCLHPCIGTTPSHVL